MQCPLAPLKIAYGRLNIKEKVVWAARLMHACTLYTERSSLVLINLVNSSWYNDSLMMSPDSLLY